MSSRTKVNWKALQDLMGLPKWVNSRQDLKKFSNKNIAYCGK